MDAELWQHDCKWTGHVGARTYDRIVDEVQRMNRRDDAVLLALITERDRGGPSIPATVAEVLGSDDIQDVWATRHPADLFGDQQRGQLEAAGVQLREWSRLGLRYVSILSSEYPQRLRTVHDAPPFLFYRGELELARSGGMSVVGSRSATEQGLARAGEVAKYLVSQDVPVISGLARGIDTAAHEATLEAGGAPIGVIATGIAAAYTPATSRALHEAVASAGVLVSQFMPDAHAMKHRFLQRNATMSGMGLATIVIEAGENSGARAQARLAMQHGRPVILTDVVAKSTAWGRALGDGSRPNVYVVSSLGEATAAIDRIRALSRPEAIDEVLALA